MLVIREGAKFAAAVAGRRRRVDCTVTFASGIVAALAMGVEAAAVKADADTDEEVEADVDLAAIAVLKARQPNRHSIQPSQVKSFFWNHLRGISRTILLMRIVLIRTVPGSRAFGPCALC